MIEINSLSKVVKENCILDSIDLKFRKGEFICILGPSGCGKTTLLEIIAGLRKQSSGNVFFDMTKVGFIFQSSSLIPHLTVLENIVFPEKIKRREDRGLLYEKALKLAEQVEISSCIQKYPYMLSGGEVQRVELCRALIAEPDVLFMDEPMRSLDQLTREKLNKMLVEIWQKYRPLIIFVTHSYEEAVYLAEKVYILSDKPSRVLKKITLSLPYPRERKSPGFYNTIDSIMEVVK